MSLKNLIKKGGRSSLTDSLFDILLEKYNKSQRTIDYPSYYYSKGKSFNELFILQQSKANENQHSYVNGLFLNENFYLRKFGNMRAKKITISQEEEFLLLMKLNPYPYEPYRDSTSTFGTVPIFVSPNIIAAAATQNPLSSLVPISYYKNLPMWEQKNGKRKIRKIK